VTDSPYAADACPGPCNRRYQHAVDDHPAALTAYEYAIDTFAAALPEYQRAVEVWQEHTAAGGLVLVEPLPPMHPGEPPAPPTEYQPGDPVWCSRCAGAIRRALAGLDDLASLLDSWADGHRGATSGEKLGKTGAKATTGSPSPIADTLDALYGALVKTEDDWREARDGYARRPTRARDARARRLTIAFLLTELRDILNHPGSLKFGLGVLAWEKRLRALTTEEPVVRRRLAVRCPRTKCRQRALRTRDDGYTQCGVCGQLLNEDEYQALIDEQDGADRPEVMSA
jgi:hypothetical protein